MFPFIFFSTIFVLNCCALAEIRPLINGDRVSNPFQGLTTFSQMLDEKTNDNFTILNDPANYKSAINQAAEHFSPPDKNDRNTVAKVNKLNSFEGLRAISESEGDGLRLFDKDVIKRSAAYGDGDKRKNVSKKKQKKIKILGRLLVKNNDAEAKQDDYNNEEENEDYWDEANGNSQGADNPNIMELIAFNPRRKSSANRTRQI